MTCLRSLLFLLPTVVAGAALAQGGATEAPPPTSPSPAQEGTAGQTADPQTADEQQTARHALVPVLAGLMSAETSMAAIDALLGQEPFSRKDIRQAAELAEESVRIAHERAEEIADMDHLPPDVHQPARDTSRRLREARRAVERIQNQVGAVQGVFRRHEAERIRTELTTLRAELRAARTAVEPLAEAYGLPMDLNVNGQSSSR